jgi:hypothetical protein
LVKNVVKQAKKYQEKLGELGKKEDIENDELKAANAIINRNIISQRGVPDN